MTTVTRTPRTRKPKPPLAARFLGGADEHGSRLLLIRKDGRDEVYAASPILGADDGEGAELLGFRVEKHDGTVYDVDLDAGTCDCPGGLQWGRCKHREGIALAIRSMPEAVGHHGTADAECPF